MTVERLDGWTGSRLDGLAADVHENTRDIRENTRDIRDIKETLAKMASDELQALRNEVVELRERSQKRIATLVIPFLCACIPAAVLLLSHA